MLVSYIGAALMMIETHGNVVESQCPMTTRGLMNILSGKLVYVCIAYLTAKPVKLSKFMIVASASSALLCIMHARNDEPYMTENRGQALKLGNSTNSVRTVQYKLLQPGNKQWKRIMQ